MKILDSRCRAAALALGLGLTACGARSSVDAGRQGTGGAAPSIGCADPESIRQADTELESGFVRCSDGFVHRVAPAECAAPVLAGSCKTSNGGCVADTDCTAKPYGACNQSEPFFACNCEYGCVTDADCLAGTVCACAGVFTGRSRCVKAECATSTDCGEGLCGLSAGVGSCGEVRAQLACHLAEEGCRVDADCSLDAPVFCSGSPKTPRQCRFVSGWECTEPWACGPCG